jgi:hypothetical protein
MPIMQCLDDSKFDAGAKRVVGVAFEMARLALRIGEEESLINERIATRIVDLAKTGERNPDLLCGTVLEELRQHL